MTVICTWGPLVIASEILYSQSEMAAFSLYSLVSKIHRLAALGQLQKMLFFTF